MRNDRTPAGESVACRVAALYIDPHGVYAGLAGVDVWDEARDARLYAGPWPVVAHPPCNRWVSYGAQAKRGLDGGCFAAALGAVRRYGGVLEHPARSQAWAAFGLPRPSRGGWAARLDGEEWTLELDQHAYGFPTRKATWLLCVGVELPDVREERRSASKGCESLWSTQRSKTPEDFARLLVSIARSAVQREAHNGAAPALSRSKPL